MPLKNGMAWVAALALLLSASSARAGDRVPASWDKDRAAKYLDERGNTWFEFKGALRGEPPNKTTCVSCHTLVPYALARPVLRRLAGVSQPTGYEQRLLEQINKRVEHWQELDSNKFELFYSFNEQKKKESRGTEAVLNALILALDDHNKGGSQSSSVTRKAFANLWQVQAANGDLKGSWEWLDFGLEPWESKGARYFGAALAAIAVGSAPGYYTPGQNAAIDEPVKLLRAYLRAQLASQNLYNRLWMLWASAELDGLLTSDEQKSLIKTVLDKQRVDGGWTLPSLGTPTRVKETAQAANSDAYATGLVVHVLLTAGVDKNDVKLARGLTWLQTHQTDTGAWRSNSVNKERNPDTHVGKFMSDAATAFAILALSH